MLHILFLFALILNVPTAVEIKMASMYSKITVASSEARVYLHFNPVTDSF